MAETSILFDGTEYSTADIATLNNTLAGNGIRSNYLNQYAVSNPVGMTLRVASGGGWVQGYRHDSTSNVDFILDPGHASFDRIDTVILRLNLTGTTIAGQETNTVRLAVLKGTPAAVPVAPTLTTTTTRYEVALWNTTVPSASIALTFATFTDRRVSGGSLTVLAMRDLPAGIAPVQLGINNGFEQCQRSLPVTTNLARAHDGWFVSVIGTDTFSINSATTNVKDDSRVAAAITFTLGTGAGGTRYMQHVAINANESNHGMRGHAVSVRGSVRQSAATPLACRIFVQHDGTGAAQYYSAYHGANTSWEDLTVENVIIPIDATYLRYGLQFEAGSSLIFYFDNVMPTLGKTSSPYIYLQPSEEIARCQRYYELIGQPADGTLAYSGIASAGGQIIRFVIPYKGEKPITPSVTRLGGWTAVNCSGNIPITIQAIGRECFFGYITSAAAGEFYCVNNGSSSTITVEANP